MALLWHVEVALFKDGDLLVFLVFDEDEVLLEGVVLKLEGGDLSFILIFNEINLSSKGFELSFFCIKFFGVGDGSEVFGGRKDFIIILESLILNECSFLTESAAVCGTGDGVLAFVFGDFGSLIFVAALLGHGFFENDIEISGGGLVDVPDGGEGCAISGWTGRHVGI